MRRFGLVATFAVRSLVLMVALAIGLALVVTQSVESVYLRGAAQAARIVASGGMAADIAGSGLLNGEATEAERAVFEQQAMSEMRHADITDIKVWDRAGVLVFSSDDADPVGASFAAEEDIATALSGETVSRVERQADDPGERADGLDGPLIEVYAPLTDRATGETIGVLEIYQSYAPVVATTGTTNVIVWSVIILGMGIAYVVQVRMVRSMADRLRATEEQVGTVNERLENSLQDLEEYSLGTLQALVAAVDAKDSYTASHSLSVTDYAVAIGRRMSLSAEELLDLERASLLHDVGKIGIPESVLLKPARLTDDEFEIIKQHSSSGAQIIESIPFLRGLVPVVRHHHEHWNGRGYPEGLEGERIPLLARVLAVADAFDAMTSDRPYRPGMRIAVARQEMVRYRGIQFDPQVVDALFEALDAEEILVALWHRGRAGATQASA